MESTPIRAVIVGGGHRSDIYAELSLKNPEKLRIVGIVDPSPVRTEYLKNKYSIPEENCFSSVEALCERELLGELVINGTMDQLHVQTAIPTLKKGYDLLLEKPLAVSREEMEALCAVAKEYDRQVHICHVLRYTEFYSTVKKLILSGEIGKPISLSMSEHVAYAHMCVSFVRGKWRSKSACFAPMLLAKSCHDLDIMTWLMEPYRPTAVSSFGSNLQFTKENKPEGAPHRCYDECPHFENCPFSAKSNYVEHDMWDFYAFDNFDGRKISTEERERSLATDNSYGICAWDFDREDNVDHQTVNVCFEGGATATFTMVGGASRAQRSLHLVGTKGEIIGVFEDNKIILRKIAPHEKGWFTEKVIETSAPTFGHAGGDIALIESFVDILMGKAPDFRACNLESASDAYRIAFAAEDAMNEGRTVWL
jgi:predicted dehydrogenase